VERPVWTGPPSYVIIDLGTLGGWSSVGLGINEQGQVAGGADTGQGLRHAFLWDSGVMTDLGTLPGVTQSEAWDINNRGQVVGDALDDMHAPPHAFLWQDGEMLDLGHLGGGESSAYAVNDSGQVVGRSITLQGGGHAFLWEGGMMTDLHHTTLPGVGGGAWDINASGNVVGWDATSAEAHAFLLEGQEVTNLGTLGGAVSVAQAVNDSDQVVGVSERPPGGDRTFHAFLWDKGEMIDLGALGAFHDSSAEAINNRGQVVGRGPGVVAYEGFLYDPDLGMRELGNLISVNSRWSRLDPRDINDAGQIVGSGTFRGARHAFLMTPLDADFDDDDHTDLADYEQFHGCLTGPAARRTVECKTRDIDRDGDVDLVDFRAFQWVFAGP